LSEGITLHLQPRTERHLLVEQLKKPYGQMNN
jgi:hypothetical protein